METITTSYKGYKIESRALHVSAETVRHVVYAPGATLAEGTYKTLSAAKSAITRKVNGAEFVRGLATLPAPDLVETAADTTATEAAPAAALVEPVRLATLSAGRARAACEAAGGRLAVTLGKSAFLLILNPPHKLADFELIETADGWAYAGTWSDVREFASTCEAARRDAEQTTGDDGDARTATARNRAAAFLVEPRDDTTEADTTEADTTEETDREAPKPAGLVARLATLCATLRAALADYAKAKAAHLAAPTLSTAGGLSFWSRSVRFWRERVTAVRLALMGVAA